MLVVWDYKLSNNVRLFLFLFIFRSFDILLFTKNGGGGTEQSTECDQGIFLNYVKETCSVNEVIKEMFGECTFIVVF